MTLPPPLSDDTVPVLGTLPPAELAAKLRAMGETATADAIEHALAGGEEGAVRGTGQFNLLPPGFSVGPFRGPIPAYGHTAHAFGYLPPVPAHHVPPPIEHAGNIKPDLTLRNARIKITLDLLRVADYPGAGMHQVLFDFYGQNQVPGPPEDVHFNLTCRVQEGERAAVLGYPIFVGLNVGSEGVAFRCSIVNVKNEDDEKLIGFLDSDIFKAGLSLAATAQPALKPLSSMVVGLANWVATGHQNAKVQEFQLGLDFSTIGTRAKLAEGSYIVVQIPESFQIMWNWDDWVYRPSTGQIVAKADLTTLIPYNYLIFGVSRYTE